MVKLFCAIVGVAGSAFSVRVDDESDSVDDLKKAIKAENSATITCDAKDLQLFLAKAEDNAWLSSLTEDVKELKKGKKTALVEALTHEDKELQGESGLKKVLAGMLPPSTDEIHVLVVVPDGSTAPEKKRKRKRMEDEDAPDAWIKAIKDEQVTELPLTCEDLREHLQRPLHVKVPVNDRLFLIVSTKNTTGELSSILDKVFEPDPRKTLSDITAGILGSVIDPLGSGSEFATEDTYHHLWDSLIAMLLRRVSNGKFRRNTNASTSTGLYRPDLCFYYKNSNVCVVRGEEKASGELQVPVRELHENLTWRYDAAPYVFGYAAVGLQVCLVAIRKDEMTERGAKVEIIETYDLGDLNGRLSFFLALLNLSTLFRPVVDLIEPLDILEYGTIERDSGVQITFAEDCVVKTYPQNMPSDDIIRNLKELHRRMKKHSVPNVVELKNTNMKKKYVKLAPVGRLSPPENVHQLLMALRDILKALVAMHAINLMHRDLRWENVLRYRDEGDKWFLIDFDEGTSSPAAKVGHLKAESHAPEILSSTHTVMVDIWSVGFLLKTSPIQDLSPELESLKAQCLQKSPSNRPSAESLLKVVESLIES
ncbi:serine/threonine protein kinase [Phytophthora nicotianae P1976]|uniref:Serine/threonine protein kinase n=1 Tax=Phytophthora nicotianae P1976 TaxID=1317066 RepID=A0A080ZYQ9_PHYNI|nr:serine/threonine protein kinase [Phytophthora nicotianae P1976]